MRDYQKNQPFALITIGLFEKPHLYSVLGNELWGKETLGGLDAKAGTNKLFRGDVGTAGIIILGRDGEIVWRGSDPAKGSYFYESEGKPTVPYYDLKEHIKAYLDKGLLGGLEIPIPAIPVAKALKNGDLAVAQTLLARLKAKGTDEFRKTLEERIEALRAQKRELFDSLQADAEKAWDAFKVGESYLRCFPKAADTAEVKRKVDALKSTPAVKDNLAAKKTFAQLAAMTCGSKSKPAPQAKEMFMKLAEKYPDTEFGKYAATLGQ